MDGRLAKKAAWKEQTGGLRLEGNSPDTKYPIAPEDLLSVRNFSFTVNL